MSLRALSLGVPLHVARRRPDGLASGAFELFHDLVSQSRRWRRRSEALDLPWG